MENSIVKNILKNIKLEQQISPFLFVWENLELVNSKASSYAIEILKILGIPNNYLFKLEDNASVVKLEDIKLFLNKSNSKPGYTVQIFIIENFSRVTTWASNSCLKIFEEPWIHNLFFLTNKSESWIIDTILSRARTINLNFKSVNTNNEFYQNLIKECFQNNNSKNLISYFFKNKLEKQEYISFLDNLIAYIKQNLVFINFLDEILEDKLMIESNNVIARNIVDKWITKIVNYE